MKGYRVYNSIKQLKDKGFKRAAGGTASNQSPDSEPVLGYDSCRIRSSAAVPKAREQLGRLPGPDPILAAGLSTLSAAQVRDWLKEHYKEDFRERTVSRYVKRLREEYSLKKAVKSARILLLTLHCY